MIWKHTDHHQPEPDHCSVRFMLTVLSENLPEQPFPPLEMALTDPDGLLAMGGCLSPKRLLNAYRRGIFPWYSSGDPILWWSPDPRLIIFPHCVHISKSLRKTLRKNLYTVTFDQAFSKVIHACAQARKPDTGTWLSNDMRQAYIHMHNLGYAHSVETWHENKLVGGLYGIAIGQVFFGESMFHRQTDASKVAFVKLMHSLNDWGYRLVDCQVHTQHLVRLGAENIQRTDFQKLLDRYCPERVSKQAWTTP